jgi:hypothetical protein
VVMSRESSKGLGKTTLHCTIKLLWALKMCTTAVTVLDVSLLMLSCLTTFSCVTACNQKSGRCKFHAILPAFAK